ncbi:MAG: GerMN domain-containing protein [Chloroflexota bacterium]
MIRLDHPQRLRPSARPLAWLAAIVIVVAACAPGSGSLGSPATPPASSEPSIEAPSSDATPPGSPTPAPSPSVEPSGTPGGAATPAPTATPAGTTIVRAYYFLGSFTGNGGLVPVLREVPATKAVATAAVRELLAGPNDKELSASPALYTAIPEGTALLGLSIEGGVATVDLSGEYASGGGSAGMFGRLAQVVYTLTQFSTVDKVLFELDGEPVTTFSSEGIILDKAQRRADYRDQLPAIFVDRPAWGAALGNPGPVSGLANVFEATFKIQLLDAKGGLIADRQVMATCGTGCWGTFKVQLGYDVSKAQWGTLRVFDLSARDGSPENVTEYPVWLTPAG